MHRPRVWSWVVCASFLMLSSVVPVRAQEDSSGYDDQRNDPPGRVARMNYTQGSISFQPGGEGEWVEAVPNRPMTTGDNLWADRNARGELHVGSTAIRIGSETSLTFLDLDDRTTQLRLAQGSVILNVRHLDDDDMVEVDTPNLAFQIQHVGEYRVDVDTEGRSTTIEVFHGRGETLGGGNNYTIVANQQAIFHGGATGDNAQGNNPQDDQPLDYEINRLPRDDGFDRWSMDRDRREDRSESASYVSREMTGYEDLDDYGHWTYAAAYGHVWVPTRVDPDWAPYRQGHWAFIAPWGWTWVDDEPWGFAPFHYGRWCRIGDSWGWIPGPVVVRPVYAPALVAFVGGGGFHLSIGFGGGGGVAWFPLGPGEVFVPAYHVSRNYVNQVNVTNTVVNITKVTNVYNTTVINNNTTVINNNANKIVYVNQTAPNGVTAVSRDTFVNARPVSHNIVQVSQRELQQAPVTRMTGVAPVQTSVMGSGRPTRLAPPAAVATRQVVAQRPPAPPPVPFAQRQDPLVAHGPRPVAPPVGQPMPPHQLPPNPGRPEPVVPRPNQPGINPSGMNQPGQPGQPHPLPPNPQRPGADVPRPNQPSNQPGMNQPAQPHELPPNPVRNNADTPQPGPPQHPEVPRPGALRPESPRQPGSNDESRPQGTWSHPLARPATPPQPRSPQQGQDDEKKFHQWQQKEKTAPPRPPARKEEPRQEKPKEPNRN